MKIAFMYFLLSLFFISISPVLSKDEMLDRRGFYGSVSAGPSYGFGSFSSLNSTYRFGSTYYKGLGLNVDLKGGYAVSNNVILHLTLLFNRLDGKREDHDPELYPHKNLTFTSFMYGIGATYYTSPSNYFYSLSAGICKIDDDKTKPEYFMDPEDLDFEPDVIDRLAIQYKMGREWRIGNSVSLGLGLSASWNSYYHYNDYDIFNFGIFLNSSF